jgi:hypothetical protein
MTLEPLKRKISVWVEFIETCTFLQGFIMFYSNRSQYSSQEVVKLCKTVWQSHCVSGKKSHKESMPWVLSPWLYLFFKPHQGGDREWQHHHHHHNHHHHPVIPYYYIWEGMQLLFMVLIYLSIFIIPL